jgi:3-dehydroquinate synthase
MNSKSEIRVQLGDRSYDIVIGHGILEDIGDYATSLSLGGNPFIVSDSKVGKLYGDRVRNSFEISDFGDTSLAIFPEGEKHI